MEQFQIDQTLRDLCPDCEIVEVNSVTEGAACTVLLAEEYINNDSPLMIANSDQYVDINMDDYLRLSEEKQVEGLIMTMNAFDNKWSFVRWDEEGYVTEVKEKEVISKEATVGIYNFGKGKDFVHYAKQMIAENARVNGEFYVAPVYNYMIMDSKKIRYYNVGDLASVMFGLGVPSDLELFLSLPISKQIAAHL
jgi:dTDP-glucose pyrophosphorylase